MNTILLNYNHPTSASQRQPAIEDGKTTDWGFESLYNPEHF